MPWLAREARRTEGDARSNGRSQNHYWRPWRSAKPSQGSWANAMVTAGAAPVAPAERAAAAESRTPTLAASSRRVCANRASQTAMRDCLLCPHLYWCAHACDGSPPPARLLLGHGIVQFHDGERFSAPVTATLPQSCRVVGNSCSTIRRRSEKVPIEFGLLGSPQCGIRIS